MKYLKIFEAFNVSTQKLQELVDDLNDIGVIDIDNNFREEMPTITCKYEDWQFDISYHDDGSFYSVSYIDPQGNEEIEDDVDPIEFIKNKIGNED